MNANLIKDEIFNLAQNGATIIFSTHRMEQVEEICNHIVLVNQGKKILDGTVQGVKQNFKEGIFNIRLAEVPENISSTAFDVVNQQDNHLTIKIHGAGRSNEVLQYFLQDYTIESFNEILPSLNDIFIHLVEGTKASRQFQPVE